MTVAEALHYNDLEQGGGTSNERTAARAEGFPPPSMKPFGGGIQLIFCGDFLQLPPVGKSEQEGSPGLRDEPPSGFDGVPYQLRECTGKSAFASVCWREAQLEPVELRTVHRQRDAFFMKALNAFRDGVQLTSPPLSSRHSNTPYHRPSPSSFSHRHKALAGDLAAAGTDQPTAAASQGG